MPFKNRLLATAAAPLLALATFGVPAQSMTVRPPVAAHQPTQDRAALAGAEEGTLLLAQSEDEEQIKRKKRKQQQQEEMQQDQQSDQPVERKKRRQQAEDMDQQQNQEEQPVERKKRNKQQVEEVQPQDELIQEEQPVERKKRNKQQVQDVQPEDELIQEEQPVERKKRNKQQVEDVQSQEDMIQEEQPVERKKRNKQQSTEDLVTTPSDDNSSIEVIETDKKAREERRKKRQQAEEQDQQSDVNKNEASQEDPARIKDRKRKAENPAKTADTIELPVENGAAVLDSDKDADNSGDDKVREKRRKQREQVGEIRVPKSDKDAQAGFKDKINIDIDIKPVLEERGERLTGFRGYDGPDGRRVGRDDDLRVVFNLNGRVVIRDDDRDRLGRRGDIRYERLDNGRIREVVIMPDGDRIVTVRNRYGEIIRRSRIDRRERETIIFFSPDLYSGRERLYLRDAGAGLPPMRLTVPVEDYIIDVSSEPDRDYEEFLAEPPVEQVERVYSVDEVKYSARIRDKVRRIDLDTITFDTGSAEISMGQARSLKQVAAAINEILDKDPGETFLIEGHTDAVGSDESNLVLSDERAESVANVLSDVFDIPAENLVTQGYGERYLKVETDEAERMNRRVTIRRITPLVRPVADAEQ